MATNEKRKKKGAKRAGSGKKNKRRKAKMAQRADPHRLYQLSVQSPESDAEFFANYFEEYTGEPLRRFREDFCGTAALSCAFVERHPDNRAWGVDLDRPTLAWGERHNIAALDEEARARIHLIQANVLDAKVPRCQLTCALNFSYSVFKTRDELRSYFRAARRALQPGGLFILDMWGGSETQVLQEEDREIDNPDDDDIGDFTYVWDQDAFDPSTYHSVNRIHFRFRDDSELRNAFVYEWRAWTMPEVRELMAEAGFEDVHFLWEGTDPKTGRGTDEYRRTDKAEADDAWIAYVVGAKG